MIRENDDPARRRRIARNLTRETQRVLQHVSHLSVEDQAILEGIIEKLANMHADDKACTDLCRYWQVENRPPWGTKYASLWERTWRSVFPNAWP